MTGRGGGSPSSPARTRTADLPALPGVVETIAGGLSLVLLYPILVLVPALVDAVAWSGLRLSPAGLAAESAAVADSLEAMGLDQNLLRMLSWFVPSLISWVDRDGLYTASDGRSVAPDSPWVAVVAIAGTVVLGTLAHAAFRVPVAFVVRQRRLDARFVVRSVVLAWLRLLALLVVAAAAIALVVLPVAVAGGLLYLLGVNPAPLVVATVAVPALLAVVYFYFAPEAIAVSEVGPLRACYLSFNVVRRDFWPVVGLIGSVALISTGLPVLWLSRADHPIGLLIGVFCHALVSTGLVMASMQFYLDRLGRWQRSIPSR